MTPPERAQVVIIGGGIVGCSVAYGLAMRGWTDVVLLERCQLTSGTTWHAAGLVTQARPTHGTREIVRRSLAVLGDLERAYRAGDGLSPGYRTTGTIQLATTGDRWEELRRQASVGRGAGQRVEVIDADRAVDLFPPLDPGGIVGGLHYPDDGRGTATDTTMALAHAARQAGVRILEHTPVSTVLQRGRRVSGVVTPAGDVEAEVVVNCTGMWGRQLAAQNGIALPLQAMSHYYIVTDAIPGLGEHLPTVKSGDEWSYVRNEGGGLMVGFFEPGGTPWSSRGVPMDVAFPTLPEDWDHIGPFFERMIDRIPVLGEVGIRLCFNGPESFTPDGYFHLGRAPGFDNYLTACGFNSIGYLSGPGVGDVLAEWIIDGSSPIDLSEVDPSRSASFQVNRRYLEERVVETLDRAYTVHWPHEQRETARGIRRTPLHDRVAAAGAVFGEVAGWERANWYATAGVEPGYRYSFGRPPWFEAWEAEHRGVRGGVGLFDLSSFGKILVQGPDALALLQRLSVSDVDRGIDHVIYTQWLNEQGGIEADVTITRVAECEFLVLTGTGTLGRDLEWIHRHVGESFVTATDVSAMYAMLPVMGPGSRALLQGLTDADLSNDAFPFRASRMIDLGHVFVRATRITYVGELGWELLVPSEVAVHVYDVLVDAGAAHGLIHAGYHALESLRLEKGYRSWGHDIGPLDRPSEAGLGFTVNWDKPGGFIGRAAAMGARGDVRRRLVQIAFDDQEVFAYHDEPIYRDGEPVGRITSAAYGHSLGRTVAIGTVGGEEPITKDFIGSGRWEVEVGTERADVTVSLRPLFDPGNERIRG